MPSFSKQFIYINFYIVHFKVNYRVKLESFCTYFMIIYMCINVKPLKKCM